MSNDTTRKFIINIKSEVSRIETQQLAFKCEHIMHPIGVERIPQVADGREHTNNRCGTLPPKNNEK